MNFTLINAVLPLLDSLDVFSHVNIGETCSNTLVFGVCQYIDNLIKKAYGNIMLYMLYMLCPMGGPNDQNVSIGISI